ncbi:hypothetical protein BESB_072920 [Besnoitia besnoiti]|uniref:Uncharacterized protein n=1 Tax=Besnoitia besnoiti TaxID=94643 RepID=A0A2A9MFI5_BESBE|nr:uncharacterized protein BESB_072920 [Besnoitia besnoiti]PFH34140.1 hypothetical protein BESB_072920 [Besnoitia besnoiti]
MGAAGSNLPGTPATSSAYRPDVNVPVPVASGNEIFVDDIFRKFRLPLRFVSPYYTVFKQEEPDLSALVAGVPQEAAKLLRDARTSVGDQNGDVFELWNPVGLRIEDLAGPSGDLSALLEIARAAGETIDVEGFFLSIANAFYWFLGPLDLHSTMCDLIGTRQGKSFSTAALKVAWVRSSGGSPFLMSIIAPKALAAFTVKRATESLKLSPLLDNWLTQTVHPLASESLAYPTDALNISSLAYQIGKNWGKGHLYSVATLALLQLLEPLGNPSRLTDLLQAKTDKVGTSTFPEMSFLRRARGALGMVTNGRFQAAAETGDWSEPYDKVLGTAIQMGEVVGNAALPASMAAFFLDAVVDPLGITGAFAE